MPTWLKSINNLLPLYVFKFLYHQFIATFSWIARIIIQSQNLWKVLDKSYIQNNTDVKRLQIPNWWKFISDFGSSKKMSSFNCPFEKLLNFSISNNISSQITELLISLDYEPIDNITLPNELTQVQYIYIRTVWP